MSQSSRFELFDAIIMLTTASNNSFIKATIVKSKLQSRKSRDVDEISMSSSQRDKFSTFTTRRVNERRFIVSQFVSFEYSKRASKRARARTNPIVKTVVKTALNTQTQKTISKIDESLFNEFDEKSIESAIDSAIDTTISQTTSSRKARASIDKFFRKITSNIYHHFTLLREQKKIFAKCKYCITKYVKFDDIMRPRMHLRLKHHIDLRNRDETRLTFYDDDFVLALSRQSAMKKKLKNRQTAKHIVASLNKQHLLYLYLRWIVLIDVSFKQMRNKNFRVFLHYINKSANVLLPASNNTIQTKIMILYKKNKKRLRHKLSVAIIFIHITCDVWFSSNHLSFLDFVIHFIDDAKISRILLLSLKKIQSAYSDANMTVIILHTIRDFEFRNKLKYFVMNNADSNDTMMKIIAQNFWNNDFFKYDLVEHRLRCLNHIINLSVQSFLFDQHFDKQAQTLDVTSNDEDLQHYRRFEFQKKLHNVNTHIMKNNQRIQKFKQLNDNHMSVRDMKVKWNSWFVMMNWSIEQIKKALQLYILNENIQNDNISSFEWFLFRDIRNFLKSFQEITKKMKDRLAIINDYLSTLNYLFAHYESATYDFIDNDFMQLSFDVEFKNLQKYWDKNIKKALVYIVVVILNFAQKWSYFEAHWNSLSIVKTKIKITKLWNTYNRTFFATTISQFSEERSSDLTFWMYRNHGQKHTDELKQYFIESLNFNKDLNLITWWLNQRTKLSTLTCMILNIFCIPFMSFESKRVFSSLKHMITSKRVSLISKIIETLKCVKHWMKVDIFTNEKLIVVLILNDEMKKIYKENWIIHRCKNFEFERMTSNENDTSMQKFRIRTNDVKWVDQYIKQILHEIRRTSKINLYVNLLNISRIIVCATVFAIEFSKILKTSTYYTYYRCTTDASPNFVV